MQTKQNHSQRILMTVYAVNPYKGSEDGMGWNFVLQAARYAQVIAVTRKNNRQHIERYMQEHPGMDPVYKRIHWWYFDWPAWSIAWKKGPLLSLIYYYMWQLTLALYLVSKRHLFTVVHNLNFHNDWTPSFLWLLGKPFIWGPIGHHPRIPGAFLRQQYGTGAWLQDRFLWVLKNIFWYADPFVYITKWRAHHIFCMNEDAARKLRLPKHRYSIMPSVATDPVPTVLASSNLEKFTVLSVGRFVPLKGFDVTIAVFAKFYFALSRRQQEEAKLVLVGAGPFLEKIKKWVEVANIAHCTEIIEWMPKEELEKTYLKSKVFLFPSHEGAGMVVAEAMSYGLPVLCFNNSGPGAFIHPESVLKVPYGGYQETIQAFADKLQLLYNQRAVYKHEQQLAISRVQDWFLWSARGTQMHHVYRTLLHKSDDRIATQNLHMA